MFFDLLYFLFLLYGTPSLISILIQIVKTITRECGELLHNIVFVLCNNELFFITWRTLTYYVL